MPNEPYSQPDRPFASSPDAAQSDPRSELEQRNPEQSELLDAVLRETIGKMSDEEAHEMISGWIAEQPAGKELHFDVVRALVKHLLSRRFRGWFFPQEQLARLARWLWEDPAARARLELLWNEAAQR